MTPHSDTRVQAIIEFALFFLVVITFVMLGAMITNLISTQWGIVNLNELITDVQSASDQELKGIRWILLCNQLFTFLLPALAFSLFYHKSRWTDKLFVNRFPSGRQALLGIAVLFFCFQAIQLFYWINKQIPLPDVLREMEDNSKALIEAMLTIKGPMSLPMNLLVMALLPAIGEELVFRGILQRISTRISNNIHLGIWITAIVFSAMHGQFEGFLPRMALGAVLGYLLYWSGSLWLPIIVHFLFNGLQIMVQHLYHQGSLDINLEEVDITPTVGVIVGTFVLLLICSYFHRISTNGRNYYEQKMGESI